jgi:alkylhydroperoxidase family enzyme
MAAHSFVADNLTNVPTEITEAIRDDKPLPDAKLNALSKLAKALVVKRGNLEKADIESFISAGYKETQILDVIVALSAKIISNYTNHIFHTPVDDVFAGRVWEAK